MGVTHQSAPGYAARAAYLRNHPDFARIPGTRGYFLSPESRDLLRTLAKDMQARGLYLTTSLTYIEWAIRSLADCLRER